MDCLLLSSTLLPHSVTNSSFHRSFFGLHSLGFGVTKKGWLKFGCFAIGGDGMRGAENMESSLKGKDNGSLSSELDESGVSFGTVSAEITQETADFFVSDTEGDPDCPSEGCSSIDQAINALRQGKVGLNS